MGIKSYRDLVVWQKSMELVTDVYAITKEFPKEEIYALTSQIRRSAVSVPSNIAEGYGRNSTQVLWVTDLFHRQKREESRIRK